MVLHKTLIRGIVVVSALFSAGYFYLAFVWDPIVSRIIPAIIMFFPALCGLFMFKNWARLLYSVFVAYVIGLVVYDWLTASLPFRWEFLDPKELIGSLFDFPQAMLYLFLVYLYSPPIRKVFKGSG